MFKEIGTLAEIGAKVGDVVACVGGCDGPNTAILTECDIHTFARSDYRIIYRANSGPVITETVTRKRIVPGVYGKVWVNDSGRAFGCYSMYTRADLIDARDVFNQLIDALEE